MERLPTEIIEKILSSSALTVEDVLNFSVTSKHFRETVMDSSSVWRHKFQDMWRQFMPFFEKTYTGYLHEIRYIYDLKRRTLALLETMPPRFHKTYQLSDGDFEEWQVLVGASSQTYHYLVSILTDIIACKDPIKSIEVVPLSTPGNKTLQYYATKVLRFIKQQHLARFFPGFVKLPPSKQTLERGATFVAQWCQTELDITEEKIGKELDAIAGLVKQRLAVINPGHQILQTSRADLEAWKAGGLSGNQWSSPECRQVVAAMREVLYGELGFHGNAENYYMAENSLINKVLEKRTGLPIILAVIYESVGRRLGLLFEPINFPAHFLLRFILEEGKTRSVYYVDTFNGGDVMQKAACPYSTSVSREVLFPVATTAQVVERIANNLELSSRQHYEPNGRVTFIRSVLELLVLVSPHDVSAATTLMKLYALHKIQSKSLGSNPSAQDVFHEAPDDLLTCHSLEAAFAPTCVPRPEGLKYAIGMVVNDMSNNDKCVIYGWNTSGNQLPWCPSTGSYYLCRGPAGMANSLFYNVLVEKGSHRCVPQDVLTPTSDTGTLDSNKDLGRHFSHFFENHYVPNAEKEGEYPDDAKVRHKFYHEMLLSQYTP